MDSRAPPLILAMSKVVICILAGGSEGVTTEPEFRRLVEDSQGQIDLALYTDANLRPEKRQHYTTTDFWQGRWAQSILTQAAWAAPSLAQVEIELYQWALAKYPNAERFILTSGDSMPIAPVESFLEQVHKHVSSFNWTGLEKGQYCHSQWKALTRSDAVFVCERWIASQTMLNNLQAAAMLPGECHTCHNMVWDECAIGTILVQGGRIPAAIARDKRSGEAIMVQYNNSSACPTCRLPKAVNRASEMPTRALKNMMRRRRDPDNLFVRKVSNASYREVIE